MFVLFRRTNRRGRTRNDGKANLLITLDNNPPQRLPLNLEGWTNQELRQQFRMSQVLVNSSKDGNHTLNMKLERNDAMDVPVTFALDYIRFTPSALNANSGGSTPPRPDITPDSTSTQTTEASPATSARDDSSTTATSTLTTTVIPTVLPTLTPTPASESAATTTKGKSDVGKIVGPVVGLVLAVIALVTILLCWRQRRIRRQKRLKGSIRPFRPVMFDRRWQEPRFSFYRPESLEEKAPSPILPLYRTDSGPQPEIEKPPLALSTPPRRVSIARASLDSVAPFLELPFKGPAAGGANRSSYQHQSFFTDSSFSAHPQSVFISNEVKTQESKKPFVSISSTIESMADPPPRKNSDKF